MKDTKYVVILIISICVFIYVYAFMPSVPLLSNNDDDVWVSNPEEIFTDFYNNGIQETNTIKDNYTGTISVGSLITKMNIGISSIQKFYNDYANTQESYKTNEAVLYEKLGITSFDQYSAIYNSIKNVYSVKLADSKNDIINIAMIDKSSYKTVQDGITVNLIVDYKSGKRRVYVVTLYNEMKEKIVNGNTITTSIMFEYKGE